MESRKQRGRVPIALCLAVVVAAGLASRNVPSLLETFGKYPGDVLWALAVFLGWMFLWPRKSMGSIAGVAFATSFAVEFSQLYQAPWINTLRGTAIGHCVLGTTFSWGDIAAYGAGIIVGIIIDLALNFLITDT